MKVIYDPKGRAKEYADLACNTYIGCPHGCVYCFAPSVMRSDRDKYHLTVTPRTDAIRKLFERDCEEMERNHDTRRVHLELHQRPVPGDRV